MRRLAEHGIMAVEDEAAGRARGRFVHSTLQEVAYKVLSAADRRTLHLTIAAVLERRMTATLARAAEDAGDAAERAVALATQWEKAGLPLRAALYWHLAAELSGALHGQQRQAAAFLLKVLELAGRAEAEDAAAGAAGSGATGAQPVARTGGFLGRVLALKPPARG